MISENLPNYYLIILDSLLLLLFLFFVFRWLFNELRNICKKIAGYIMLGQLIFILLSWGVFLIIFFYYIIKPEEVNVLHIFLTVIVGFLGTVLGVFFSEKAFEKIVKDLEERYKARGKRMMEDRNKLLKTKIKLENIKKEYEKNIKN